MQIWNVMITETSCRQCRWEEQVIPMSDTETGSNSTLMRPMINFTAAALSETHWKSRAYCHSAWCPALTQYSSNGVSVSNKMHEWRAGWLNQFTSCWIYKWTAQDHDRHCSLPNRMCKLDVQSVTWRYYSIIAQYLLILFVFGVITTYCFRFFSIVALTCAVGVYIFHSCIFTIYNYNRY